MKEKGHSEEYFGDFRDYWYNLDFLELMAKRWKLENVRSLLDVGCGQCHWSRLLSSFLGKGSSIIAVDADEKWSLEDVEIKKFFAEKEINFEIKNANVQKLPFPDNTFDVVTCQTVLIHLENPFEALMEMKRVLKPNGIMICAEPNNLSSSIFKDSITANFDVDEIIEWFIFGLIKEKGKINLGLGDNSVGDLLPKMFSQLELKEIKTYLSDKSNVIIPPYQTKEIQAMLKFRLENNFEDFMKAETLKQFSTFGDKYKIIQQKIEKKIKKYKLELKDAVKNQNYYDVSTAIMFLVSGRK